MPNDPCEAATLVQSLSRSIAGLREVGIVRSRRIVGDLGEWYVETLFAGERASNQTQKGWDVRLGDGARLQVKTQSFDPQNQWNYLDTPTEQFDRLIVVVLTDSLTVRMIFDVPSDALVPVLRKERTTGKLTWNL